MLLLLPVALTYCGEKTSGDKSLHTNDSVTVFRLIDTFKFQSRTVPEKARKTLNQLENYIDSTHYERMRAKFYINKGQFFYNQGIYDTAAIYYDKGLASAAKDKNRKMEGVARVNYGNLYYVKGEFLKALTEYKEALTIMEALGDQNGVSTITGNLGAVYVDLKDYKKAKEWLTKSLETKIALKDSVGIAQAYGNLGTVYYAEGNIRKCLNEQFKSYSIHKSIRNKTGMAVTLGNIAEIYQDLDQQDSATTFARQSMEIHSEMNDQRGISSAYITLANIAIDQKKNPEALNYLQKAKDVAEKLNNLALLKNIEEKLVIIHRSEKQFKEAFTAYKKYITYRDSLFNTQKINELNKKEIQFENDKKEALSKAELEEQKLIRNGAFAAGILLLIYLVVIVRSFINKRNLNKTLHHQKQIIEEKQKEIVDSINYALQIQKTLLANHEFVNQTIPDSFVIFKPKDIVSGDFYWATSAQANDVPSSKFKVPGDASSELQTPNSNLFYLAVCDSTGHGVPGAFMSLLNISFLNEAIKEKNLTEPGAIFEHVRRRLIDNISQ
ncbi:MAG: hypothetical protein K0S12_2275, partial [Bacteroidetes bacterium]|nr:hypothetical protein [Bacteroidota bacterium]